MRTSLLRFGLLAIATTLATTGCRSGEHAEQRSTATDPSHALQADDDEDAEEVEEEVAVADVPDAVLAAAVAAVPGLVIDEAEREGSGSSVVYCLEGAANGERYDVDVTPAGKVVEVERGDDDEDDD